MKKEDRLNACKAAYEFHLAQIEKMGEAVPRDILETMRSQAETTYQKCLKLADED